MFKYFIRMSETDDRAVEFVHDTIKDIKNRIKL